MAKIVLTGGGTCGHIMPNIALLPELYKHFDDIYYMGEVNSREEKISREYKLGFYHTDAIKLSRTKIWKNLAIPYVLNKAVKQAKEILRMLEPDVIFSKGGYVSLPCVIAGHSLKIPIVIHESDRTLGVANKLSAHYADKVICSYPLNKNDNKYVTIGNPIRSEILCGNPSKIDTNIKLRPHFRTILVVGGSLGALAINDIITDCLDELLSEYNIIHITGNNYRKPTQKEGYFAIPYVDNIGDYYANCDLVISRAGAGAIAEISALGLRAIYIPLPKGNSRGDQVENAKCANGYVIEQENLTKTSLLSAVRKCMTAPSPSSNYNPDIPKLIVNEILLVMNETSKRN